ncbi:SDR family oxidoreductase [Actinomycetospora corticicola]|uniref:NAD(P)-dependent dehydrogenase (Short-subunit alcohol dehydrogenase family) n=1 Tax=Actinomycetospora corticicola TaxID=663602 RepID=A0A7Y9J6Q0_9PSEU|nr:glucose 1-dehydrogenase [Actinomycetospora corticicola]NYD37493.1 NAD(P)-dependent dehydrogenase (short-subunit alcohol dehydrogenase family) [Actinomycetospora corticicola]
MRLENKVALVTGAGAGLGHAIAARFAAEGAHVYITGRRADVLDQAAASVNGRVTAVPADSTSTSDLVDLAETIRRESGHLDILVANAGIIERADLGEISEDHYDRIFDTDARGTMFTVQTALPLMPVGGSIVLVGSIQGVKGLPGSTTYSAAKAAVRSYARVWAAEFGDRGLRVNVLSPGPFDTPIIDGQAEYFGQDPAQLRERMATHVPLGRLGRPDELAAAALFLASDDSSFMTGAELCVDGGMAQV